LLGKPQDLSQTERIENREALEFTGYSSPVAWPLLQVQNFQKPWRMSGPARINQQPWVRRWRWEQWPSDLPEDVSQLKASAAAEAADAKNLLDPGCESDASMPPLHTMSDEEEKGGAATPVAEDDNEAEFAAPFEDSRVIDVLQLEAAIERADDEARGAPQILADPHEQADDEAPGEPMSASTQPCRRYRRKMPPRVMGGVKDEPGVHCDEKKEPPDADLPVAHLEARHGRRWRAGVLKPKHDPTVEQLQ